MNSADPFRGALLADGRADEVRLSMAGLAETHGGRTNSFQTWREIMYSFVDRHASLAARPGARCSAA